jgi:hypothetical protein
MALVGDKKYMMYIASPDIQTVRGLVIACVV